MRTMHGDRYHGLPVLSPFLSCSYSTTASSFWPLPETDIFLQRLLALETLHVERTPMLSWNELTTGYEVRNFLIALE